MNGQHDGLALRGLVEGYIAEVLDGRRIVGRAERLAVERHVRDLDAAQSGARPDWRFNESLALVVLRFAVGMVKHTKGRWAGQPFAFTSRSAWSAFFIWALFGWQVRRPTGEWQQRFDEALLCTGRKQGKTMIGAIIALAYYLLLGEHAPEVYVGATQRKQAAILWRQAAAIVRTNPALSRRLTVARSAYQINKVDDLEAAFEALSRNDDEFDGLFPSCVILDEVHAHPDSGMYDVLRSGMQARENPLRLMLTTRGANPESFYGHHERRMLQVLDGVLEEDSTLVFVASLDDGDDCRDPLTWPKALPNIGVTVDEEKIKQELRRALNDPGKMPEFERKYMNRWTNAVRSWLPLPKWDACGADVQSDALVGKSCWVAVDLSKSDDFTAACAAFPRPDGTYEVIPQFWLPEEAVQRRRDLGKAMASAIDGWLSRKLITLTPGPIVDQEFVKEWIYEMAHRYRVREVSFDPAQSWKIAAELMADGRVKVVNFPQEWAAQSVAIRETENLILSARLRHGMHPVLRWMFTNVVTRETAGGLTRLDKRKSADKIDGIQTLVMAVSRAVMAAQKKAGVKAAWA